jgi:O-antigen ligase
MILILFGVSLLQKKTRREIWTTLKQCIKKNRLLFVGTILFLLAATISIFTSIDIRTAAGEWKAFYVEPILLGLLLAATIRKKKQWNMLLFGLVLSGLATSILAIYQHFTGWMVPSAFWENRQTFRVTAWYGFPNGVGLFLGPIVPLALYLGIQYWKRLQVTGYRLQVIIGFVSCVLYLISAPFAIFFAKSTGAIIGVAAGIGLILLFYKKTRWPAVIIGALGLTIVLIAPSFSNIRQELLLQDRSGQIRISIWRETMKFLEQSPVLGAGLASYEERIAPYHTTVNGEGIEIFHHPHNIFLTMWVNLGLLGLLGFFIILIWFFKKSFKAKNTLFKIFFAGSMATIVVMGLVDSPYIKNDLALLFWLLPALLLSAQSTPLPQNQKYNKIKKV